MPIPVWPPKGYVTIRTACDTLGLSRQRLHVLIRALDAPDRVETDGGLLLHTRVVDRLRRRNTTAGRPRGWRKPKREDQE